MLEHVAIQPSQSSIVCQDIFNAKYKATTGSFSYQFLALWGNADSNIDSLVPSAVGAINVFL